MFPILKCRAIQIEDCLKIEKSKVLNVSARFAISDSSFTLSPPRSLFSLHYLAYLWSAPGEKSTLFRSRIFLPPVVRLSILRLQNFDQHISLWYIICAIFIFSNQNHRNLSLNIQMFPKRVKKGQITATSIHQQSLLTSRICKHVLCSLGGPSRRSRKTSRFWKHVQWGSGVAARPHISTVIWTAT